MVAKPYSVEVHVTFNEFVFSPNMQNLATRYVRVNRHLCVLYETLSSFSHYA